MIPDPLDRVDIQAEVIDRLASGETGLSVAKSLGISPSCVSAFRTREEEAIRDRRIALRRVAFSEAEREESFAKATRARLEDAQAAPGTSKSAPQSYRAVSEVLELVGGPRELTVNGDIIDARSVTILPGREVQLSEEDRARYRALRSGL